MLKAGFDPVHPALLIEESIQALGLTITAAAEKLGISRKHLSNIIHERAGVTPPIALRLEKLIGGNAEIWLGLQGKFDLWKLRQSEIIHEASESTISDYIPRQTSQTTAMQI